MLASYKLNFVIVKVYYNELAFCVEIPLSNYFIRAHNLEMPRKNQNLHLHPNRQSRATNKSCCKGSIKRMFHWAREIVTLLGQKFRRYVSLCRIYVVFLVDQDTLQLAQSK